MHATATLSCLSVCDRKSRSQSMDWGALHPSHSPQWYHSPCLASSTLPSSLAARRGHIRLASGLQGRARAGAQDTDSIVAWPRVLLSGSSRLETHATIGALICTWPTSAGMSLPMSISLILANRVKRQKGGRDFEGTPLHHYGNSPEESYNGPSGGLKNAAGAAPPPVPVQLGSSFRLDSTAVAGAAPLRVSSTDYDEQTQARTRTRIMTQISGFSEASSPQ